MDDVNKNEKLGDSVCLNHNQDDKKISNSSDTGSQRKSEAIVSPKYRYNRDELMALKEISESSLVKPVYLSREFELEDGRWDPEKWFHSTDHSADAPQLLRMDRSATKNSRTDDRFYDAQRCGGDFRRRGSLCGNENDTDIVLGPQRNNFNTGCSAMRAVKCDNTKEGREKSHRVGKGRVLVTDKRQERADPESNDRRAGGRYEYEYKEDRNRKGEKRDANQHVWINQRERSCDGGGGGGGGTRRNDRTTNTSRSHTEMRHHAYTAEPPEWFTQGPSSRTETIELRGFGLSISEEDGNVAASRMDVGGDGDSIKQKDGFGLCDDQNLTSVPASEGHLATEKSGIHSTKPLAVTKPSAAPDIPVGQAATVNGGLVAGNVLSEQTGTVSVNGTANVGHDKAQEFDFNDFFKVDSALTFMEADHVDRGSSRFKAFFSARPSSRASDNNENCQRSSLLEFFPYLNEVADGCGNSSLPPSPPIFGHHLVVGNETEEKKHFMNLLEKANLLPNKETSKNSKPRYFDEGQSKDTAVNLKGMINAKSCLENSQSEPLHSNNVVPSGSKALLAEDLEANFLTNRNDKHPPVEQTKTGGPIYSTPNQLPHGSKITHLAELEGHLLVTENSTQNKDQQIKKSNDTTAFDRLLNMVQGYGTTSQKTESVAVAFAHDQQLQQPCQKTNEQNHPSSSTLASEAPAGCSLLALSQMEHQDHLNQNRVVTPTPITSSPIMFGSQPPTNLMTPLALRSVHGCQRPLHVTNAAAAAAAAGSVVRPSYLPQVALHLPDSSTVPPLPLSNTLLGLAPSPCVSVRPSNPSSLRTGDDGQSNLNSLFYGDQNGGVMGVGAPLSSAPPSTEVNGRPRTETGKMSPAFMPTAVMRKIINEKAAANRTAAGKAKILSSLNSDQPPDIINSCGTKNETRCSQPFSAASGISSHMEPNGAVSETTGAISSMAASANKQTLNFQLLQAIKNQLEAGSSSGLHNPVQVASVPVPLASQPALSSTTFRGYMAQPGLNAQSLNNYPTPQQPQQPLVSASLTDGQHQVSEVTWSTSGNKKAIDILAQLQSQSGGGGGQVGQMASHGLSYQHPYNVMSGGSSQIRHPSNMGSADMAAFIQQLQSASAVQTRLPAQMPTRSIAPPPIGRAIVKGTGLQHHQQLQQQLQQHQLQQHHQQQHQLQQQQNNQVALAMMIHQMQQKQQQQQHPAASAPTYGMPVPVPATASPSGMVGVSGTPDRWNNVQSMGGLMNSVQSNGGTGMGLMSTSSVSGGNYNSANLSRFFGEEFLRRQQMMALPLSSPPSLTSQGHTPMTVNDLERQLASLAPPGHARLS